MVSEYVGVRVACGDGKGACSDGTAAGDVVGRVSDDPRLLGCERHAMVFASAAQREGSKLVAQFVVIGEGSKGERVPQAVTRQLDLGAAPPISGE
jgi:hypothetical protein